ncbi:methyltransferase [Candidatus Riflebacteria bacterium]
MNQTEWHPGKLMELSGGYWKTCALHAAVKLEIFSAIGEQSLTGEELAQKLDCSKRGLLMLLNSLRAMDLLQKEGDKFNNTQASKTFLCKDSPAYMGFMIMHHHHIMQGWIKLAEGVKTGAPVRKKAIKKSDVENESFLMGMFNSAMNLALIMVEAIDLTGRKNLLDMGGGPGTYAIHFCKKNPEMKATVFDLATTRPFAEKTIARFNMQDRVSFSPGNYLEDEVTGDFDVVWLSHVLHSEGPEGCMLMLKKAVSVLRPGGMIIIHEFILNDSMDGPLFPALFALNMLLGTEKGQAYSESQLRQMLEENGIKDIHRIPLQSPNDSGLIAGTI